VSEAHRRNIVEAGAIGLLAGRAADAHAKIRIGNGNRDRGMGEPGISGPVDILDGAEGPFVFHALGALVDQTTILPVERDRVIVAFDDVLADFRPDAFERNRRCPTTG
jgi:hypothetical protein